MYQTTMSESMRNRVSMTNADLFDSLISVKNDIRQINVIVTQNSRNIEAIKDSLSQITTILQKIVDTDPQNKLIPYSKSPSIPEEVNALSLAPIKGNCIKSIIEDESNFVGRGSFGTVYGGNYNGQAVAIKKLTQESDKGEKSRSILCSWEINYRYIIQLLDIKSFNIIYIFQQMRS